MQQRFTFSRSYLLRTKLISEISLD